MTMFFDQKDGFREFTDESLEWLDGEDEDGWRKRLGYEHYPDLGIGDEGSPAEIRVMKLSDDACKDASNHHLFLFEYRSGEHFNNIYAATETSLLVLWERFVKVAAAENALDYQKRLTDALEKMFRVQHGHAAFNFCQVCDPDEWDLMQRRRAKREAMRKSPPPPPPLVNHSQHGRADASGAPRDPDCVCRGSDYEAACANVGCGFCRAALGM